MNSSRIIAKTWLFLARYEKNYISESLAANHSKLLVSLNSAYLNSHLIKAVKSVDPGFSLYVKPLAYKHGSSEILLND